MILDFFNEKNSRLQEQLAEYSFLRDLIIHAAKEQIALDISRSDVDMFGYDLIVSRYIKNKHESLIIQLKATSGKARAWDVHKTLLEQAKGRIILILLKNNGQKL